MNSLLDLVSKLLDMADDELAQEVVKNGDVKWCLSELYDILEAEKKGEIDLTKKGDDRMNQTAKADAGKAQLSLVPFQIVYDIARVREHGTMKYGDPANWKQVEPQRYVDALLRHTLAFAEDMHSTDQESGLPHLWHAATNIAFLCELLKEENNGQAL